MSEVSLRKQLLQVLWDVGFSGLVALGLRDELEKDITAGAPIPSTGDMRRLVRSDEAMRSLYPNASKELDDIYS
jgi:hypothetical protein